MSQPKKPCPYCGNEDWQEIEGRYHLCRKCGSTGPLQWVAHPIPQDRRTPGPATAKMIDAFKRLEKGRPLAYNLTRDMVAAFVAEHEPAQSS